MQVNVREDGTIEGYLPIKEWCKKNKMCLGTGRMYVNQGKIPSLRLRISDQSYCNFIPEDFVYDFAYRHKDAYLAEVPGYLSTPEYATSIGVSEQRVENMIASGTVKCIKVKIGEDWRRFIKVDEGGTL